MDISKHLVHFLASIVKKLVGELLRSWCNNLKYGVHLGATKLLGNFINPVKHNFVREGVFSVTAIPFLMRSGAVVCVVNNCMRWHSYSDIHADLHFVM